MNFAVTFIVAAVLLDANAAQSGVLLQTLPDDGAWVTFLVTAGSDGNDVSVTWTLRSVGTAFYEGRKCRYLEVEQSCENGPQQIYFYQLRPFVLRALVPEDAFGEGKDPLAHAVRMWAQEGDKSPVTIASADGPDPILAAIVSGPVANLNAESRPEKISWQRGELNCSVLSGNRELKFVGIPLTLTTRVLRSEEVPFSIGGLRQDIKAVFNGKEFRSASVRICAITARTRNQNCRN